MLSSRLLDAFSSAALSPDPDLAVAALMIARIEYPELDASRYVAQLDFIGDEACRRLSAAELPADTPHNVDIERYAKVAALNVYMEVARRAGLPVERINFPGHFLLRCRAGRKHTYYEDLIIDPFHGGALLSNDLLAQQAAEHGDSSERARFESRLLPRATKQQILSRMLMNLKRVYVNMQSFPQARNIADMLIAVDPSAIGELRDRGLLAYNLKDFSGALRDLQAYLKLIPSGAQDDEERKDRERIWEHVKTLRKRVASLN